MRDGINIKYPVKMWQVLGYDDKLVALNCIKEWLLGEMESLRLDIEYETNFARIQKIEPYLIQIFKSKLEERKKFLSHLVDTVFTEIKKHEQESR